MSEHSKGPELVYHPSKGAIRTPDNRLVADVYAPYADMPDEELHALGRQMAAAPGLVEALRNCVARLAVVLDVCGETALWDDRQAHEAGQAALQKAGVEP